MSTPPAPIDPALELRAGPFCLRPWQDADVPDLYAAVQASVEQVGRWLPWCHPGYSLADAQAWVLACAEGWRRGQHYAFGLHHDEWPSVLGGVDLNRVEPTHRNANLGYWVASSAARRGLASTASRLAARFAFERLQLVRVEILVEPDNLPSRRCAERIGAQFEGVARNRLSAGGPPRAAAVYGLLAEDLLRQG